MLASTMTITPENELSVFTARCTVGDNGRSGDSSLGYLPEALLLSRIIKEDLLFSSVGGWSLVHSIIV